MKEFIIPFFGLKTGKHVFSFEINRSFFEAFENSLLEDASLKVKLELEKMSNMLILEFKSSGTIKVPCDRCGEELDLRHSPSDRIIVKFGDESFEQTDEILVLSHDSHEIDVSQEIYEMIVLNIPNKRVHKSIKDCDQEVIKKLEELNKAKPERPANPRWDALNKLKN